MPMPVMFQISVPIFDRRLKAHAAIMDKAAGHAEARAIDPQAFMMDRLYPDMFPYWLQVQSACDHAKNSVARLTGQQLPILEETAKTFAGLKLRIERTLAFVNGTPSEAFAGADERTIVFTQNGREQQRQGMDYFQNFALPNFYFHLTTAYGILRHNGVEIGKRDFMGNPPA